MRFAVRWFEGGQVREQGFTAPDKASLEAQLRADGKVVLSVAAQRGWGRPRGPAGGMDADWWCRELRTLLTAGMTVVEALETIAAQPAGERRGQVHAQLLAQLRDGKPLSVAMAATAMFSPVLVASVRASERTSNLVEALDDYLHYHEMLSRMQRQLVSAAIYPAVVVGLGLLITLLLLVYVMPRFARLYGDLQGTLSTATSLMLGLSQLLTEHLPWLLGAMVLLALALGYALRQGWHLRAGEALVEGVPLLRRQADELRLAKLYQTLALLFKGGYSLDEALRQSALLGLGARFSLGIQRACDGLVRGQGVSATLADAGLADPVGQRLLAVGERTGNFDRVLHTLAERHGGRFQTFVERASRLMEPLLLMMVALLVGGVVLLMYMPVFDMASSVR